MRPGDFKFSKKKTNLMHPIVHVQRNYGPRYQRLPGNELFTVQVAAVVFLDYQVKAVQ